MMVLRRAALPLINAMIMTAGLFGLMYSLIYIKEPPLNTSQETFSFKPVCIPKDSKVAIITARPPEPDVVQPLPSVPTDLSKIDIEAPNTGIWEQQPIDISSGEVGVFTDSQLTIAMGFQPVCPSSAALRNIEGYVVVGFSVDQAGEVFDGYVLESTPSGTFDRSALKAIKKFKYRARMVEGKPMSTDGQRYMFTCKLES